MSEGFSFWCSLDSHWGSFKAGSTGYVLAPLQWVFLSMFVAKFREDVRITIPAIAERLKASDRYVRSAAIEILSGLAVQGMC